jgi:predicted RND superfamily exporter protein
MAADNRSILDKYLSRWRWVLLALLFLATGLGLSRIRVDANVLDLLPQDLVAVRGLKIFLAHFGQPRELIVMIEASDSAEAGALVDSLADDLRATSTLTVHSAPPWAADPRELVPLAAYALLNQDPEKFDATLKKLSPAGASARASEAVARLETTVSPEELARLAYDPLNLLSALPPTTAPDLANREFSSLDGRTRLLYVNPSGPKPPKDWVSRTTELIRKWQSALPERLNARVGWTGEPAFVQEISGAMESDMRGSSISALAFAALIFYLAHRRLRPLWGLLFYVCCSCAIALGLTALLFPGLTIISAGFVAISAGLTMDYGFIIYQRRIAHGGTLQELRAATIPGILASATTTAAAFLSLNLSGLPCIAQLGTAVAIGVIAGALLMIIFYAKDLQKMELSAAPPSRLHTPLLIKVGKCISVAILVATIAALAIGGFPPWTKNANATRPRVSVAYPTLERMDQVLGINHEVLNVVVPGDSESIVAHKLAKSRAMLEEAVKNGSITSFELPDSLWPREEFLNANLASAALPVSEQKTLRGILDEAGFSEAGAFLTSGLLDQWEAWCNTGTPTLQGNTAFEWIARRTINLQGHEFAACGVAVESGKNPQAIATLVDALASEGIYLTGWQKLGEAIARHALAHGLVAAAVFAVILCVALRVSLGNIRDTLLVLATTGLSLVAMTGLMRLFSLDWNFLNLCSITLTIGAGVDSSIHMIFALRESRGDHADAFRDVGKALGLGAATNIAGFGSLATAQTVGLASLDINCALGVALNALFALFLLPVFWHQRRKT